MAANALPALPLSVHLGLGTIVGVCLGREIGPAVAGSVAGVSLFVAVVALAVSFRRRSAKPLVWLALGLSLATFRAAIDSPVFRTAHDLRTDLPDWPHRTVVKGDGIVRAGERATRSGWQVTVAVEHLSLRGDRRRIAQGRLRLRWRMPAHSPVGVGDRIAFSGTVMQAPPKAHPFDWDRRVDQARRGLAASVHLWGGAPPRRVGRERGPIALVLGAVDRLRLGYESRLRQTDSARGAGWLLAVGTGSRSAIDDGERDLVTRSGVAHLLAVSGLHLGIFVLSLRRAFERVLVWLTWPLRRRHRRVYGALLVIPLSWLFVAFTGTGTASVRAAVFVTALALADLLGRPTSAAAALGAAVAAILLWRPAELYGPSFQLSAVAVAAILVGASGSVPAPPEAVASTGRLRRVGRWLGKALRISVAVTLATAPVLAHHFGRISLSSVLANVLVAPFLAVALVSEAAVGLVGGLVWPDVTGWMAGTAEYTVDAAFAVLTPMADLAGDPWVVGRPGWSEQLVWAGVLLALAAASRVGSLRRKQLVRAALMVVVVGLLAAHRLAPPGDLEAWFLPVGQGDAALLRLPSGHTVLVDTGGSPTGADPGRWVVLPVLRGLGVQRLDLVVVTHPDLDHSGGLDAVIGAYPPRELWWGGAADHPRLRRLRPLLRAGGTRIRIPDRQRTRFRLGMTTIELLHPLGERRPELSDNDNSICLRVGYGGRHLLLPGDVEAATESRLLAERADQLSADVLKVAHHGSRGSSGLGFLAAVFPRVAVISAGLHNRFDFPHAEVLTRLRYLGVHTYRTDLDGLVVVRMSSQGISVSTARGR